MRQGADRNARLSYAQANACARRVLLAETEDEREILLRLQEGWLALARVYEFTLQLTEFPRKAKYPFDLLRRTCRAPFSRARADGQDAKRRSHPGDGSFDQG